ncbi:hypothetical protein [Streptomyces sp. NPDC059491]|uniref:hypothetical protein n=1 Tax=Streptomyces sp. NPDC059491 TaxID=3346850 RepID=UPI0036883054
MPNDPKNPCDGIWGQARELCEKGTGDPPERGSTPPGSGGFTEGASDHVKDLADWLLKTIKGLLAPETSSAVNSPDSALYSPFLWLGQHLAVAIFVCVVVVCGLTAWQGVPRLRQMGASTGWTLAAVAGMAAVPGIVTLLQKAVSAALTEAFDSNEATLFNVIRRDLDSGGDAHPLGMMILIAALCVALACAALVFAVRQPAIIAFVCMAPLVMASLARGGDMGAVKKWAGRLLGLLFAPFALLVLLPFVPLVQGELAMDVVLLVAADVLMLRMVFHGVPYFGPRVAGAARAVVERSTDNRAVRAVMRAGVPDTYEQEDIPRGPRTVDTPGRAMSQDRAALLASYGIRTKVQPGRLTTASAAARVRVDADRTAALAAARRAARAGSPAAPASPGSPSRAPGPRSSSPGTSGAGAAAPGPTRAPAPRPPAPGAPGPGAAGPGTPGTGRPPGP